MIVEPVEPWELSPIAEAYKKLVDDIDNSNLTPECRCDSYGLDDGNQTCWRHHDCRDGTCTHIDGED